MKRIIESDVCIVGAGMTAAMVAEKLTDERELDVLVVEAGNPIFNYDDRFELRRRWIAYGENPWPDDHIEDQTPLGTAHGFSRTMAVGGLALHYGGASPRYSPEDFRLRSLYGIGDDWPITYEELDPFYQEAEERMGVAGEQGPPELDPRSKPYPMPAIPRSYNLERLREWGESWGVPFWTNPQAKNTVPYRGRGVCCRLDTCNICPVGARYSPDYTFRDLLEKGRIELITRTLVRRLVLAAGSDRIGHAVGVDRDSPDDPMEIRARTFVLAAGYVWSPHLLLLSAESRYPEGLANRSGLVGKYLAGHRAVTGYVDLPFALYPGMNAHNSLLSKKFQRPGPVDRYVRHDFRIWEASSGDEGRIRDDSGRALLGDEGLADWRERAKTGTARLRCYYDVLPARESALTLDRGTRNRWGDPMPRLDFRDGEESAALRGATEERIRSLFEDLARAGSGTLRGVRASEGKEHPGGGCRMGDDPASSVVDAYGRSHDHENLFVVGAPTLVTAGCNNSAPTLGALGLLAASKIGEEFPAR
jgi:quinoprotein glucose dehydrogenase